MSRIVPDHDLRGLGLADNRFSWAKISAALSAYTEGEHEPAQPTPDQQGYLQLESLGTLTADAEVSFSVNASKGGAAVGGNEGGRFTWRYDADAADERRGHFQHNKVTGFELVTGAGSATHVRALRSPDHKVVCVWEGGSGIGAATLDPVDDTWTEVTVAATGGEPSLIRLSSGRLVCLYRTSRTVGGSTQYTVSASYSDDDGATWATQATHIPGYQSATAPTYTRAWYHDGYITLLVVISSTLYHYVSVDQGASFEEIETIDITAAYSNFDGYIDAAGSVVLIFADATDGDILYGKKHTPFGVFNNEVWASDLLTSASANVHIGTALDSLCCTVCDEGYLWIYWRKANSRGEIRCGRWNATTLATAKDETLAWGSGVPDTYHPISTGDNDTYLNLQAVVPYKDRLLLLGDSSSALSPGDLTCLHLGGYSSVTWSVHTPGAIGDGTNQSGYGWLAFEAPSTVALWTVTGAGTFTLGPNGGQIQTTANDYIVSRTGSSSGTDCLIWARVKATSGGSLSSDVVAVNVRRANNTVHYNVSLRLHRNGATQEARLFDNLAGGGAGAAVGSDVTGLGTGFYDWLIAIEGDEVWTAYKAVGETLWTVGPGAALTDGGAGTANNRVQWGHRATGTAESYWMMVLSCLDTTTAPPGLVGFSNPEDLVGRPFSTLPLWLGEGEGYQIQAKGGAAFKGDSWTAATRARYGVRNLHPEIAPSLDTHWRSVDTSTEVQIAWALNSDGASRVLSSSLFVALLRPNFRLAYLEGYTAASTTWTTLLTLGGPATLGSSLTYDVSGNWIRPKSTTPAGDRVLRAGELVGGYALLTYTGGGGGTLARKILRNTEGVWRDPSTSRAVELLVEGSTSAINTPTTIEIIPPALVGVAHQVTSAYDAYRLRIPSGQTTAEGFYRLGKVLAGPLLIFGRQYSWGRVQAWEPQQDRYLLASGVPITRGRGRPRRRVEFAWTEPLHERDLFADTDPDYVAARDTSGYPGLALRHDAQALVAALAHAGDDPCRVLYLPKVDKATGLTNTTVFSGPDRLLYGAVTGPVTLNTVMGDEAEDEVVAVNSIAIEEEG